MMTRFENHETRPNKDLTTGENNLFLVSLIDSLLESNWWKDGPYSYFTS